MIFAFSAVHASEGRTVPFADLAGQAGGSAGGRSGFLAVSYSSSCQVGTVIFAEMEIGKWRSETGARNPPLKDRDAKNRPCQPNPREYRGFVQQRVMTRS
jgi:hypothetical protein